MRPTISNGGSVLFFVLIISTLLLRAAVVDWDLGVTDALRGGDAFDLAVV